MRCLKFATIFLLFAAVLTACAHNAADNNQAQAAPLPTPTAAAVCVAVVDEYSSYGTPYTQCWQDFHMYVEQNSVTPTSLRLHMVNNNTEMFVTHGMMFRIEQFADGAWHPIPHIQDSGGFLPLLHVSQQQIVEEDIRWDFTYGPLPPGLYRIVRNFELDIWPHPVPRHRREIPAATVYATFTITDDWQTAHAQWLLEQKALQAAGYARFAGLDLVIVSYSTKGVHFTLTNNNPHYSYVIFGVSVGYEDAHEDGWVHRGTVYSIFRPTIHADDPPRSFGDSKILHPGEFISFEAEWYSSIGYLSPRLPRDGDRQHIFDVVVWVFLDVDEDYINENFHRYVPGVLRSSHHIRASFDLTPYTDSNPIHGVPTE